MTQDEINEVVREHLSDGAWHFIESGVRDGEIVSVSIDGELVYP